MLPLKKKSILNLEKKRNNEKIFLYFGVLRKTRKWNFYDFILRNFQDFIFKKNKKIMFLYLKKENK